MSSSVSPISTKTSIPNTELQSLSPCSSGRRSNASNSSEFEFWMVRNPSSTQPNLLSADELFVDGVLLPLHLLHLHPNCNPPDRNPQPQPNPPDSETPTTDAVPGTGSEPPLGITESTASTSTSKRWKDIFKKTEKQHCENKNGSLGGDRKKEKRNERKNGIGRTSGAELNINIWPFLRSRSAGNAGPRPKMFYEAFRTRKVNSAPCSRSNSSGESKSRKWPASPSRPGVHLGRSNPIWQVKRSGSSRMKSDPDSLSENAEKGIETLEGRRSKIATKGGGAVVSSKRGKSKVLNLNVTTCVGYEHHLGCRIEEIGTTSVVDGGDTGGCDNGEGDSNVGNKNGNLFNIRNLFTKKKALTSH